MKKIILILVIALSGFCFAQSISNDMIRDGSNRFIYLMDFTDENGYASTTAYMITFPRETDVSFVETEGYSNRLGRNIRYWTISSYILVDSQWYFVQYDLSSDSCGEAPVLYCMGRLKERSFGENVYEVDLSRSGFKTLFNCEHAVMHYDEKVEMYQEGDIPVGTYIPQKINMSSLDINESYMLPSNGTDARTLANTIQSMLVKVIDAEFVGRNRYGFD